MTLAVNGAMSSALHRVLLVEDDERVADVIRAILNDAGFGELDVVHTAEGAEMRIRSARPDLVLIDLGLPDRDGTELIRALRAASFDEPILVVSTATASEQVLAALRNGADGYLFKEDLNARLLTSLYDLVRGGTPLSGGAARLLIGELRQRWRAPQNDVALPALTRQERRVLDFLSDGATYAEIGRELNIGVNTVRTHIRKLYDKLGVENGPQAVSLAWSLGFVRAGVRP